ncbi:MAG: NTP transferase domain-containing protein [Selenomonadaceae bacterium]|nr:NTP transferase domain-containing protein [Selenomonadaceae bacterium]
MQAVKNVVIAAAGMGTRLGAGKPKSLIKINGKALLEYQLSLLEKVENVFLVVGFMEEDVMTFASKIRRDIIFVRNANFQHTKTLGSFYLAARNINGSAIFMDGDMIIEPRTFDEFLETAARLDDDELLIAVSKRISDDPVYCAIEQSGDDLRINGFSFEEKSAYEWANVVYMPAGLMINGNSHTFEHLQKFLPAAAKVIDRLEIDTPEDLRGAEKFFKTNDWFGIN